MKRNMNNDSDVYKQQQIRPKYPFPFHAQNTVPPNMDSPRDASSEFRNPSSGSSGSITDCLKKFREASSVTTKPDASSNHNTNSFQNSQTSVSEFGIPPLNQQPNTWQDTGRTFSVPSQPFQGQKPTAAQWNSPLPFSAPVFCSSVPPPGLPPFTRPPPPPPPSSWNSGTANIPVGQSPPAFPQHNFGRGSPQNNFRGGPPQNNFGGVPPQNSYRNFPHNSNLRNTAPSDFGNASHANNYNSAPPQTGSGVSSFSQPSSVPRHTFPQGSSAGVNVFQDSETESMASKSGKEDGKVCDSEGQREVNTWLTKIGKLKADQHGDHLKSIRETFPAKLDATKNQQQSLSFGEAQSKLRSVLHALAAVQGELQQLEEDHMMADTHLWEAKVLKIKQFKEAYCQAKQEVDMKQLKSLKKKYELRKKKRERQRRHKQEKRIAEQQALFERAQKHAAIDQWRNNILQQYVHQQQVKQMKETADKTLSKVRREIREARKMLDTVNGLEKLRAVRCDTAEKRGQTFPPSVAEQFKDKAQDLTQLLAQQIEVYEKEEAALKLILETEKEEAEEKKKEEKRKKEKEMQQMEVEQERLCLFGSPVMPAPGDQMQSFINYYQQSVYSLQSLQNIRNEWDQFLVPENTPMASRIPDGWVCPEPPQSSVWASVLHQQSS